MRSILPLKSVLIRAWQEGRLCLTLPWVIEFLKMSAWDTATAATAVSTGGSNSSTSMHSWNPYYDAFSLIKTIQKSDLFHLK